MLEIITYILKSQLLSFSRFLLLYFETSCWKIFPVHFWKFMHAQRNKRRWLETWRFFAATYFLALINENLINEKQSSFYDSGVEPNCVHYHVETICVLNFLKVFWSPNQKKEEESIIMKLSVCKWVWWLWNINLLSIHGSVRSKLANCSRFCGEDQSISVGALPACKDMKIMNKKNGNIILTSRWEKADSNWYWKRELINH